MATSVESKTMRLLDIWDPPEESGESVGCIATSYTFDTVFFEEECLGRFVEIESDPSAEGISYLVEREEKLQNLVAAVALVDSAHCTGTRSIRWDLVPVRMIRGAFHPKIVLLCWQNAIRLCVSSANLTIDGYRKNREIAGVLDYSVHRVDSIETLVAFLNLFESIVASSPARGPESRRVDDLIAWTRNRVDEWSAIAEPSNHAVTIAPILVVPGGSDLFDQVGQVLPAAPRATLAHVASPFYSHYPATQSYTPALRLWQMLNQRGDAEVTYCVLADERDDGGFATDAPITSLLEASPQQRASVTTSFECVTLIAKTDHGDQNRFAHLKSVYIENDRWAAHLVGSSNFTAPGTGVAATISNYEANLLYIVRGDLSESIRREMRASVPAGIPINTDDLHEVDREDIDVTLDDEVSIGLPPFFASVVYRGGAYGKPLQISFDTSDLRLDEIEPWQIMQADTGTELYSNTLWYERGRPTIVELDPSDGAAPSVLRVVWGTEKRTNWWPVILHNQAALPPPEELRNLPLELLIAILSSARPLHQIIGKLGKHSDARSDFEESAIADPHKRVDTSSFILQRTRRASWALERMRERIERPVVSREQLEWRLRDPIGILAFVNAVAGEEEMTSIERQFLLAEIAVELKRVRLEERPGCLDPAIIERELDAIVADIHKQLRRDYRSLPQTASDYLDSVLDATAGGAR